MLDKGFLNETSQFHYRQAMVKHLVNSILNHFCLFLCLKGDDELVEFRGTKRFFFEATWVKKNKDYKRIVSKAWNEISYGEGLLNQLIWYSFDLLHWNKLILRLIKNELKVNFRANGFLYKELTLLLKI